MLFTIKTLPLLLTGLLAYSRSVGAQGQYGQASCSTTLTQTSVECCGTVAAATSTTFVDCHGCAPIPPPEIMCKCVVAPVTDPALTSTARACRPTRTPIPTLRTTTRTPVARPSVITGPSVPLPSDVAAWCKDRAFIAIFPPTPAQRCCEGELAACEGLLTTATSEAGTTTVAKPLSTTLPVVAVPTECSYVKCLPETQCSRCCGGDLRACDGLF